MPHDSLFEREHEALAKVQQLVRDRAAGERAIVDAFAATTAEAEREVQKGRRVIAAARKKASEEQESSHQQAMADFESYYDSARAEADQSRHDLRKKVVDHYSQALEKTRTDYQDKLWTVDSLKEARDKESTDRYQELKRKVDASQKRAEAIWTEAGPSLTRVGLSRAEVFFDPDRLPPPTETDPVGKVQKSLEDADTAADRLARAPLRQLLGIPGTLATFLLAGAIAAGFSFWLLTWPTNLAVTAAGALVGGLILRILIGLLAQRQIRDRGTALGIYLAESDRAIRILAEFAERTYLEQKHEAARRHSVKRKKAHEFYRPRIAELEQRLAETLAKVDVRYKSKAKKLHRARVEDTSSERERYDSVASTLATNADAELAAAEKRFQEKAATATTTRDTDWAQMSAAWHQGLAHVAEACQDLVAQGAEHYPRWSTLAAPDHPLPLTVPPGVRFGSLDVDLYALPEGMPFDPRLNPSHPLNTKIPAFLPFPSRCSVLLKTHDEGRPAAIATLQAMMLRFLTGLPPGKVRFTIIDPVGLGENFASFMHLADYDEKLVSARIWTEPAQIDKRLTDLTEHMENVIQKYLRNQYKSIEEYNRTAGEVAEPYRVLVVANFPTNFTPDAARRLISIMSSGPACGVCTLVSVDAKAAMPRDFRLADLEQIAFNLVWDAGKFRATDPDFAAFPLTVDAPPSPDAIAGMVRRIGLGSLEAARVEVPFEYITPPPDKVWTGDASKGLEVPIGRAGATRRQVFSLGKGTAQHALVAGKTGSGKSTLLHALITNLSLIYSPQEAELYLIDFKEGVEFKDYAVYQLPHARVVAIESEREFGLSVLQRLDVILRTRGDDFRHAGVNDLAGYREQLQRTESKKLCPRILLVVDEFQQFFVEDDKLAQEAALLLDRLVRQGRAFGIHVLLGSQTLGGSYSIPRATIDQMAVRIALQCSEADAQLILSKDNTAARLLNRPGEAIYNDANGLVDGNDPFQVVWLSEGEREKQLSRLRERAAGSMPPPLVFEGNASADVTKNTALARLVGTPPDMVPAGPPLAYLGDPVAIKEPTAALFRPQSAANLLLLGQQEEAALAIITSTLTSLAARLRPNGQRVVTVLDGTPDDSEFADYLRNAATSLGLNGTVVERSEMPAAVAELAAELERRQSGTTADRSPRFLIVHGLHRLRELRKPEEDFGFGRKGEKAASPGEQFFTLLRDGPPVGIHIIVWCDSLTNLQRALDRSGLREFSLRVLFQMSPSDSSHLTDSPIASRLGRNRALFIEEGTERPEKFRPYAVPAMSWLRQMGEQLAGVTAGGSA